MRVFDISERLACRLVGLARSSFRRPLNRDIIDDPDKALRAWLRDMRANTQGGVIGGRMLMPETTAGS
jgi:hypothetical protein